MSAKLPDPVREPELYEHVKAYQIHTHSRTCRNMQNPAKNNVDDCDSIFDILCELEINKDDYYTALGISKNN